TPRFSCPYLFGKLLLSIIKQPGMKDFGFKTEWGSGKLLTQVNKYMHKEIDIVRLNVKFAT
ncbi:hypothetical protein HHI36_008427, partial [Cryptolaemus montrouzieri]